MKQVTRWDMIKELEKELKEIKQKEQELIGEAQIAATQGHSLRYQELCAAIAGWRALKADKEKMVDEARAWLRQRGLPSIDPVDELKRRIADYPRRQRLYDLLATREELMIQLRVIHLELKSTDRFWNAPTFISCWKQYKERDNIEKLQNDLKALEAERDMNPGNHVIDPELLKTSTLSIDIADRVISAFRAR